MVNKTKNAVLVVGSGSIALKHIQNLISLNIKVFVLNTGEHTKNNLLNFKKKIQLIKSVKAIKNFVDFAIIANSTNNHVKTIKKLAKNKIHIFCEKPISNNLNSIKLLKTLIKKNKIIFSMNYQLNKHDIFSFIKKNLDKKNIISVSLKVGQNIKNWRLSKPIPKSYYLNNSTGGGVIFELIHEINLVNILFGDITLIKTIKKSSLTNNKIEDLAISIFKTKSQIYGTLHQDMLSKKSFREIEIICKDKNIYCDLLSNKIEIFYENIKKKKVIQFKKSNCKQINLLKQNLLDFYVKIKNNDYSLNEFYKAIKDLKICIKMHKLTKN